MVEKKSYKVGNQATLISEIFQSELGNLKLWLLM